MFKSPGMAVTIGTAAISMAGLALGGMWFAYISDRKPRTMNPQWEKATAKYRAAQNQDPISKCVLSADGSASHRLHPVHALPAPALLLAHLEIASILASQQYVSFQSFGCHVRRGVVLPSSAAHRTSGAGGAEG